MIVLADADQRRRQRAEHVRERDALRHRRHRHELAERVADDVPMHEARDDPRVGEDLLVQQRADDGQQHAQRGELHAAPRLVRLGQAAQAEDEQHGRAR